MKAPWPFSVIRTITIIMFDLAALALVGFVLFSGYVL
jgi:hypothetical protein